MGNSYTNGNSERLPFFNAVCLQNAVLCADCDCVSDSPHDRCLVCGSSSLFNLARVMGGNLSSNRPMLIEPTPVKAQSLKSVLNFPGFHRIRRKVAV
jgi:hypothetical protein